MQVPSDKATIRKLAADEVDIDVGIFGRLDYLRLRSLGLFIWPLHQYVLCSNQS